jgi:hypothetical protein
MTIQVTRVFTEGVFLARTQKTMLWSIRFNICLVVYLLSQKNLFSQPELSNWTRVSYKSRRSTEGETKREAKYTKERESTGSTKLPLPIVTQIYKKRKVKINRKPFLRTRQNLHQSI